jgi:hypothetical protein
MSATMRFWRAGWPVEAMQCAVTEGPLTTSETPWRGALRVKGIPALKHSGSTWYSASGHYLPCEPIWSGFVLDSVTLAILWFTCRHAPRAIRRQYRRGAARCVECGYARAGLRSSTCPECGDSTDDRVIAAQAIAVRRRVGRASSIFTMFIVLVWSASLRWSLCWTLGTGTTSATVAAGVIRWRGVLDPREWRNPGFALGRNGTDPLWIPRVHWSIWDRWAAIPLWTLAAVAVVPSAWGLWGVARLRRQDLGAAPALPGHGGG